MQTWILIWITAAKTANINLKNLKFTLNVRTHYHTQKTANIQGRLNKYQQLIPWPLFNWIIHQLKEWYSQLLVDELALVNKMKNNYYIVNSYLESQEER